MKVFLVAIVIWANFFAKAGGPAVVIEPMPDIETCKRIGHELSLRAGDIRGISAPPSVTYRCVEVGQ